MQSGMVRLVQLQPEKFKYEIECDLVQAPLGNIMSYEALSYTWGHSKRIASILLKSQ